MKYLRSCLFLGGIAFLISFFILRSYEEVKCAIAVLIMFLFCIEGIICFIFYKTGNTRASYITQIILMLATATPIIYLIYLLIKGQK